VEDNLKELKKNRPISFGFEVEVEVDSKDGESSEVDSSDEEIDLEKGTAVNKPIDRLKIKPAAKRNALELSKAKQRALNEEKKIRKFNKDLERLENLAKQGTNEAEYYKKKLEK